MLERAQEGKFDPREVPSMLIGKPVPRSICPATPASPAPTCRPAILVNWFASWCAPCAEEAPVLMDLKRAGVPIWGIAYKDKPAATSAFLARHGNPFARVAHDVPGRVAIDWGVTGVPETYLVDAQGMVRWRYVGPLTAERCRRNCSRR